MYLTIVPPNNDGSIVHRLTVKDVPVDGFWSITMYNEKGYIEPNEYNVYSLNNITAKKSRDGSVTVQFGGCDGKIPNCLPIKPGVELLGAPLPTALRNFEWHVEIPRPAACHLSLSGFPLLAQSGHP